MMPVKKYIMYYIVDEEAGEVHVIRILYSGMNQDLELQKNTSIHESVQTYI